MQSLCSAMHVAHVPKQLFASLACLRLEGAWHCCIGPTSSSSWFHLRAVGHNSLRRVGIGCSPSRFTKGWAPGSSTHVISASGAIPGIACLVTDSQQSCCNEGFLQDGTWLSILPGQCTYACQAWPARSSLARLSIIML